MGTSRQWKRARKSGRSHGLTGAVAVDGKRGGIKMSEVLADFAEPLLRGLTLPEHRKAFEAALKISALLWNATVRPPEGGYRRLYAEVGELVGSAPGPDVEEIFDAMIVRGRALYPGLDRVITRVEVVVESDGRCRIEVASGVVEGLRAPRPLGKRQTTMRAAAAEAMGPDSNTGSRYSEEAEHDRP